MFDGQATVAAKTIVSKYLCGEYCSYEVLLRKLCPLSDMDPPSPAEIIFAPDIMFVDSSGSTTCSRRNNPHIGSSRCSDAPILVSLQTTRREIAVGRQAVEQELLHFMESEWLFLLVCSACRRRESE
jgi:hypothetical protein